MKWWIPIFSVMMAASTAQANENCATVELDHGQQALSGIPVWDQGEAPSCYVYSSTALAMTWVREVWAKGDSRLSNFSSNAEKNYRQIKRSAHYQEILDAERGRTCQALQFILKAAQQKQRDPTLPFFTLPECEMWGIDLNSDGTHKILKTPEAFEDQIHALLTASDHPLPFGIEYCSNVSNTPAENFIVNRTFRSSLTYLNTDDSKENFASDCGFHSAVVIGQKIRNGSCYFKIRNSDGPNHPGDPDDENGNDWIPANALARNTLRLIQLKSP